jgi:hypothetical protein
MAFPLTTEQLTSYAAAYQRTATIYTGSTAQSGLPHRPTEHDQAAAYFNALAERIAALVHHLEAGVVPQIGVLVLSSTFAIFGEYVIDTTTLWRDAQRIPNYAGHQTCVQASAIKSRIQDAAVKPAVERDLWISIRSCLKVLSQVGYPVPEHVLAPTPRTKLTAALSTLKRQHDYQCFTHFGPDGEAKRQDLRQRGHYVYVEPGEMTGFDTCERQVRPIRLCWDGNSSLICSILADAGLQVQDVPTSPDQPIILVPVNTAPVI